MEITWNTMITDTKLLEGHDIYVKIQAGYNTVLISCFHLL